MNQILLFESDFISQTTARLCGRRLDHLNEVLTSNTGDIIRAGKLNAKQGTARILSISQTEAVIETSLTDNPPPPLQLKLVCAMQRPKTLRKILQFASSAGIKDIYIIRTWRTEKSYLESPVLDDSSIFNDLILGLEQSRDTVLPRIYIKKLFRPFVEDELPEIIEAGKSFVAHPTASIVLPSAIDESVTLAMGPEGGFIPFEIELLEQIGFAAVTIGSRIFRSEYALPVIVGRLFSR